MLDAVAQLQPWSIEPVPLNYVTDEGEDGIRASFGPDNYERLARLKSEFDPHNIFHRNANIRPA